MPKQWRELSAEQRRIAVDAIEVYDHFLEFAKEARDTAGGMFWKTVPGRDYLVRSVDRRGHLRSLGPRSDRRKLSFENSPLGKKTLEPSPLPLFRSFAGRRKFCVAAEVNRIPRVAADVARVLDNSGLLGTHLIWMGSHA